MKQLFRGLTLVLTLVLYFHVGQTQTKYAMSVVRKGTTRVSIARNLGIEMSGECSPGVYPNWFRVVKVLDNNTYNSNVRTETVMMENFTTAKKIERKDGQVVLLGEKDGKAVLIIAV